MKLIGKPLGIALVCTALWLVLRLWLGTYLSGDEGVMAGATIAFLAIAYALFAGFLFVTVWGQWNAVEDAVRTKNLEKFTELKDKRIPPTVKFLLVIFSALLVGAFFLLSFQHLLTGSFAIFSVSLVVSLYWAVIMDLDDPFNGIWNVEVPSDWKVSAGKKS